MAHIVILGAGSGGMPAAYELRDRLGPEHEITVVNERELFQFVPSNPWVAVGWRHRDEVTLDIPVHLARKGINFVAGRCERIDPAAGLLHLGNGDTLAYDQLVLTTGARFAYDEVPGAGPNGHTASVCSIDHAEAAFADYQRLLDDPGPVVVGALPGASCLGPMYEMACIFDTDLRRRGLRERVPITLVTPEPYVGHFGLGGVAESRGMLERELQAREIEWISNARISAVSPGLMRVEVCDAVGAPLLQRSLPFGLSVVLPAFTGVPAVAAVEGLCDERGLVRVDAHQRSPAWPNIWAAGLCVSIPCAEPTPVPTAAPATGYMIESMVRAIVHNLDAVLQGADPDREAAWNAICLADMGDSGAALVALPQIAPRRLAWMKKGKWVHMAKIAFEKYFMHKMKRGTPEPVYEKYILKMLGIERFR